jgi:actin-related protein
MVPTLVGVTKLLPGKLSEASNQWGTPGTTFVGFEALRRSSVLSLKYPMEHGIIMDWDEIGQLLEQTVQEHL